VQIQNFGGVEGRIIRPLSAAKDAHERFKGIGGRSAKLTVKGRE